MPMFSDPYFSASTSAQPDGRGPAQLHPRTGPTAAAFCRRNAGEGVHHATAPLESAGSAAMDTYWGLFRGSWGPGGGAAHLRLPCVLLVRCTATAVGAARGPMPTRRPYCTAPAFGRPRRWVDVDAIVADGG